MKLKIAGLSVAIESRDKKRIIGLFSHLNGIPAYSGIITQKVMMAKWLRHEAHCHGIWIGKRDLPVTKRRKSVKVYI